MKIESETKANNWRFFSSEYYNKNGDVVMNVMSDSNFKHITYYEYRDTLLVKLTEVKYENGKLSDSLISRFSYKLDNNGSIIENKLIFPNGDVRINKIKYNKNLDYDTTYRYELKNENDHDSVLTECCSYIYRDGERKSYCHDSAGWRSQDIKITEYFTSDTLQSFLVNECKVIGDVIENCKPYYIKIYYNEGRIIRYEHEKLGVLAEHTYIKNAYGLIEKHIRHSKSPRDESTQVDTYRYYFRN